MLTSKLFTLLQRQKVQILRVSLNKHLSSSFLNENMFLKVIFMVQLWKQRHLRSHNLSFKTKLFIFLIFSSTSYMNEMFSHKCVMLFAETNLL